MPWLINAAQVDKFRKTQKSLIILDASLHMPDADRDAKQEFLEKHIPGAQFFDIDLFSEQNTDLPHMLMSDENSISEKLGFLGIRNDYKIIFYDNSDLHSACRALWMMKIFGHNPHLLYILDGGLPAWEKYSSKKIETGKSSVTPKKYSAKLNTETLCTLADVKQNLHQPTQQVIDVRHPARFAGAAEPRPHLRPGHIPGSYSLPYSILFDKQGCFLPLEKIKKRLINTAINPTLPTIVTCGSAITAPILDFLLDLLGNKQHRVYDGSWSEWGEEKLYSGEKSLDERPVATCLEEDCPEGMSD